MKKKHFNIPVFIPEAACPFQCIYCNQRKISGKLHLPDALEINNIIEDHLTTLPKKDATVELAYFGGNFTGFTSDVQKNFLNLVNPYIRSGEISGIRLSTRPDYINPEILDLLKDHHVKTIELGAQSMDDEVLKKSKRGHTARDTEMAANMIIERGFNLGLQMMIGLPGDTFEKSLYTAQRITELGATETRIYPTLVIRDTILEKHYLEGRFEPLTLEDAVSWSAELLQVFEEAKVKVLKLGLHPSEGLLSGSDLVAGPWHQSFRELVLTRIWRQKLQLLLGLDSETVCIEVPSKEINYAVGYGGSNKKMLLQKFISVEFNTNAQLNQRSFNII
ncbi:MAG: radical SAM protein [Bacteroidales bacterium]|nr:radical SAM protein [Bacteroidales bacterium]